VKSQAVLEKVKVKNLNDVIESDLEGGNGYIYGPTEQQELKKK